MIIPRPVEPGHVVEALHVDDERIAIPAAVGPAHPEIDGRLGGLPDRDRAAGAGKLIGDHDLIRALDDLERVGQIRGPWYTGQEALGLRVAHGVDIVVIDPQAILEVLLPLCQGLFAVRDFAALDDALAGRLREPHADLPDGRRLFGRMVLNVPVRRDHRLPESRQVRVVRALQSRGAERLRLGLTHRRLSR